MSEQEPKGSVDIDAFFALLERELGKEGLAQLNIDTIAEVIGDLTGHDAEDPELLDIGDAVLQRLNAPGITKSIDVDAASDVFEKLNGINLSHAKDALPVLMEFFRSKTGEDVFNRAKPVKPIRNTWVPPGRNDTCPCGSGKKFKKCHMHDERGLKKLLDAQSQEAEKSA
jgi:hypothetical protein